MSRSGRAVEHEPPSGRTTPRKADAAVADMAGAPALPRRSGEMVFHDDWERRAFAMAVALCERGLYEWDEFRQHLVAAIDASGESPERPDPTAPGYYEHWLASLEGLLADKGVVDDPFSEGVDDSEATDPSDASKGSDV